ncbi:Isotrichodermin C-15 hydroxylase [Rhypophila sp. PSN 637]
MASSSLGYRVVMRQLPDLYSLTPWTWILAVGGIMRPCSHVHNIYNTKVCVQCILPSSCELPGPKLASFSGLWEAYHMAAGRWSWVLEDALCKYGDVVRIGPNSLVFVDPKAFLDIHGLKRDLAKTFIKTPLVEGLGDQDDGLLWERDTEKHRRVSKLMSPSFSGSSLRAKVPTIQKYVDLMVKNLKTAGCNKEVVNLTEPFLEAMEAANIIAIISATSKTYPIVYPLALFSVPWKVLTSLRSMIHELRVRAVERMDMMQDDKKLKHPDYFEQLLPADQPAPAKTKKAIGHMLTVAGQMILGAYDPTSVAIWMLFFLLLGHPEAIEALKREIRGSVQSYDDIEPEKLRTLPWLNACIQETLRLGSTATHHSLPRISPGGLVNGEYIPKGLRDLAGPSFHANNLGSKFPQTVCRSSLFTYNRIERFFHCARSFRPERWLSPEHHLYNPAFAKDDHSAFYPFILGPRQCPGREIARITIRLVAAKMFWQFDIEQLSKLLDFDHDMRVYGMWVKPKLEVRLTSVC